MAIHPEIILLAIWAVALGLVTAVTLATGSEDNSPEHAMSVQLGALTFLAGLFAPIMTTIVVAIIGAIKMFSPGDPPEENKGKGHGGR